LAANLISEFLMNGKQVIAAGNAADPDSGQKRSLFPNMPIAQAALLRKNLAQFAALGVQLSDVCELDQAVLKAVGICPKPIPTPAETLLPAAVPTPGASKSAVGAAVASLECPERLISARLVQGLPIGTTLRVGQKAVITEFAKDLASSRSIRIERA
jgi:hypothetical protein